MVRNTNYQRPVLQFPRAVDWSHSRYQGLQSCGHRLSCRNDKQSLDSGAKQEPRGPMLRNIHKAALGKETQMSQVLVLLRSGLRRTRRREEKSQSRGPKVAWNPQCRRDPCQYVYVSVLAHNIPVQIERQKSEESSEESENE